MKSYYVLSKSLNGFDLNNYDVGWTEIDDEVESDNVEPDDEYDHIYIEVDWDRRYPPDETQLQLVVDSFKQHNIMLHIDAGEHSVNYDAEEKRGNEITFTYYSNNEEFIRQIVDNNFSFKK